MVRTQLDGDPEPVIVTCAICSKPLKARYHWLFNRWIRGTVHDQCSQDWEKKHAFSKPQPKEREMPPRFEGFDSSRANAEALAVCGAFSPSSALHTLAIIGLPARGKSRLMWATITSFFDELERATGERRWVDYYLFTDLAFEPERAALAKAKIGKYVFIDDIGSTESYGRDRAQIQDVIRTRIQKGMWTFLTIDNQDFDQGFKDIFRDRAVDIWILQ